MSGRLTPDADADELRVVVRDFLGRHTEPVREPDRVWDDGVWRRFAAELGAAALDVPEKLGGAGAGFREVAVVAEELGRSLARLPWFSTAVLGAGALMASSGADDVREDLLVRIASGTTTATLAHRGDVRAGPGLRLEGRTSLVVEGATADVLLAVADTVDGPTLLAVDGEADGVVRTPVRAVDPGRQLADVEFHGAVAVAAGHPGEAAPVVERVLGRARVALACEQTGGAAAAMDTAVRYAGERLQFGRPIATFQAIKHRCADMALRVEDARSASLWAVAAHDTPDGPVAAAVASLVCADAYRWVAAENVQVHGGIGFTWEHPAHLHVRRAATSAVLFGGGERDAVLSAAGLRPGGEQLT